MAKDKDRSEKYDVGYKKPPRHSRFRKGQSGNPNGRPKGTPNFKTALDRALQEKVIVNEGGRRREISKLEAMIKQLVNKAVGGDARSREQLLRVLPLVDPSFATMEPEIASDAPDAQTLEHLIARIRGTTEEDSGNGTDSR